MDVLIVIIGIIWVVIASAQKKKVQAEKAAQEAARRQQVLQGMDAQVQQTQNQAPSAAPYTSPYSPPQSASAQQHAASQQMQQPIPSKKAAPAPRHNVPPQARNNTLIDTRTREAIGSNLTEISATQRHTLQDSFSTVNHIHEETSMSGVQKDCATTTAKRNIDAVKPASAVASAKPVSVGALRFDQNAILSGLIYSEILNKPKALRGR